ncbi:hypothetical protein ACLESO_21700 [Pyxidicoccus sp. 3LG]
MTRQLPRRCRHVLAGSGPNWVRQEFLGCIWLAGNISGKAVGVPLTMKEREVLIEPALLPARAFDEAARLGAATRPVS